jgi:uncharacterized protein YoaH (UPF0181 family)
MNSATLKLTILQNINRLSVRQLVELNRIVLSMINEQSSSDDWHSLSKEQQQGIVAAIQDLDANSGISSKIVIENQRTKIRNFL